MTSHAAFSLHWMPPPEDFDARLAALRDSDAEPADILKGLQALATARLDFMQTRKLDKLAGQFAGKLPPRVPRLRLALLGTSTLEHLVPGIRVAALRRGLVVEAQVGPYGQWRQQILDESSELYAFKPHAILLCLDQSSILSELPLSSPDEEVDAAIDDAVQELVALWRMAR